MTLYLWSVTVFALVSFVIGLARLAFLRVDHTVGGRASIILMAAMILHAVVGIMRRLGWDHWVEAQAIVWTASGAAALGVVFTRSYQHKEDRDGRRH